MDTATDEIFHVVYLEQATFLVKRDTAEWRDLQTEFADYKASMGPYDLQGACEFLDYEYGVDPDRTKRLARFSEDPATLISNL